MHTCYNNRVNIHGYFSCVFYYFHNLAHFFSLSSLSAQQTQSLRLLLSPPSFSFSSDTHKHIHTDKSTQRYTNTPTRTNQQRKREKWVWMLWVDGNVFWCMWINAGNVDRCLWVDEDRCFVVERLVLVVESWSNCERKKKKRSGRKRRRRWLWWKGNLTLRGRVKIRRRWKLLKRVESFENKWQRRVEWEWKWSDQMKWDKYKRKRDKDNRKG